MRHKALGENETSVMYAAALLVTSFGCDSCFSLVASEAPTKDMPGWIDITTYEPLSRDWQLLHDVVNAIQPFLNRSTGNWDWRVFSPDGLYQFWSDGRLLDDEQVPIDGTSVFDDMAKAKQ